MEEEIENLIEELTKVRPEMLNEEALKLFNTIMAVLDERDKLKEEYDKLTKHFIDNHVPKSKIIEQLLNPMKEEHDKAIKGFMKRDIPQCIEDGGIAQVLGCFIGKIEELLEDK